ncbi:hypothetical protein NL676_032203 [Syzygium grande]|nr:hypothetical protein NL676_032203 [Syzygium grande]
MQAWCLWQIFLFPLPSELEKKQGRWGGFLSGEKLEFDGVFRGKIFENGGEINKSRAESEMGSQFVLLEA